ncbi:Protein kinase-like domain [Pseudocohnilembus persalinus]|uniref:non-specific serine/threonine protein kinase n=1 Tax=Pseudocohnilembus persalinus TaxID=266149 RepID=A0A0V0QGG7_PSEPJ|nr:Protein kinase-like domain [Pseudocohnilembus persalinus]|eukprot:KRX01305.1 Protein kinase-like domain [Pseudocohnilembus persalinus]
MSQEQVKLNIKRITSLENQHQVSMEIETNYDSNSENNNLQQENDLKEIASGNGSKIFINSQENTVYKVIPHSCSKIQQNQDNNINNKKNLEENSHHSLQCFLLKNEFEIVQKLNHPNIIKYFSYEVDNLVKEESCCSLQMEKMDSDFFDHYIAPQDFQNNNINQFKQVLKTLLETVAFLHANEVTHNDIKPENLFLKMNQNNNNNKSPKSYSSEGQNFLSLDTIESDSELTLDLEDEDDYQQEAFDFQNSNFNFQNNKSFENFTTKTQIPNFHSQNFSQQNTQNNNSNCKSNSPKFNVYFGDFGCANSNSGQYQKGAQEQLEFWKQRELSYAGPEVYETLLSYYQNSFKNKKSQNQQQQNQQFAFDEKKNDIFSLGQTAFMCITKKYPKTYQIPSEQCPIYKSIMQNDLLGFYEQVKDFCPQFQTFDFNVQCFLDICMQMMQPNPQDRPDILALLKHPFFQK